MRLNKYLFTIFIIFLLLIVLICDNYNSAIIQNLRTDKTDNFDGYIIQLNEQSIAEFKNKFRNRLRNEFIDLTEKTINLLLSKSIENYKNHLLSNHKNIKENISKILEKYILYKDIFTGEFFDLFNGISIKNVSYELIQKIKNLPYIKKVLPNYKIYATLDVSVPLINADDSWEIKDSFNRSVTGKGVTVAILDTGVDYNHIDLKDNFIEQGSFDFVNNDTDPMDDYGHGTHCAGIICGKGTSSNYQYIGVAPDTKFYAIKILDQNGEGSFETYLRGMERAIDPNDDGDTSDHADIISLSFGTQEPGRPDDQFCEVVDNVVKEGVIVVVAAGNCGPESNTISSPGCAFQSICIGSTDKQDVVAYSSSRGPVEWDEKMLIKPDIIAPGVSITSTKNGGGYTIKSGTSMAVPHVAGAASLILQMYPDYSPEKVKQILKENSKNLGYDPNIQGSGRLDLANIFKGDTLYIESPSAVNESSWFTIKITDKNNQPVKAMVLIKFPYHLPRLRYGSTIVIKSPIILSNTIENLKGEINVFKTKNEFIKKGIIVVNKK